MPRTVPPSVRAGLQRESFADALLAFVQIDHASLQEPIRVVCDPVDFQWAGSNWIGIVFDWKIVSDNDRPPEFKLAIPNVDRAMGQALESLAERARVSLYLLSTADFDLSASPRTEVGVAEVIYQVVQFELIDVECSPSELVGTVRLRDYSQEPYPGMSATQTRLPGLFE